MVEIIVKNNISYLVNIRSINVYVVMEEYLGCNVVW